MSYFGALNQHAGESTEPYMIPLPLPKAWSPGSWTGWMFTYRSRNSFLRHLTAAAAMSFAICFGKTEKQSKTS